MKKDERLNFFRPDTLRAETCRVACPDAAGRPAGSGAEQEKSPSIWTTSRSGNLSKPWNRRAVIHSRITTPEIDLTRRVSVKAADENVVDVVIRALSAQNLTARMEGSRIVVSRKPAAARVQTAQPVEGG